MYTCFQEAWQFLFIILIYYSKTALKNI